MVIFAEPLVRLLQGIDRGGDGAGFARHQNLGAGNDHTGNLVAFLELQLQGQNASHHAHAVDLGD